MTACRYSLPRIPPSPRPAHHPRLGPQAFYVRIHRVPSPEELGQLTAQLLGRILTIERLQRTKLDAAGALLWHLARSPADGCQLMLDRYFADELDERDGLRWAPPVGRKAPPVTLRGDVHDFVSRHIIPPAVGGRKAKVGSRAPLTGRAVARILHGIQSPAFTWKEWHADRSWGTCREVDFEELRQLAEEVLETARRREKSAQAEDARKKRKIK